MRVLVTRPRAEAEHLAALLAARGVAALVEPMFEIRHRAAEPILLDGVQALLFTSANGVRAFAALESDRGLPVFAVGDHTAEAAREAGFAQVESAAGAAAELAALVRARLDPAKGALLHGAGAHAAADLAGVLAPDRFEIRTVTLYDAVPAGRLSNPVVTALRSGDVDAVMLFSPRAAATFVSLARDASLQAACERMVALCLSQAVAQAASGVRWRKVEVAARPELPAMLDLLPRDEGAAPGEIQLAADGATETPAERVIRAFGGIRPMATKLGLPVTTVQGWKSRGNIPPGRAGEIIAAARRQNIAIVEADLSDKPSAADGSKPIASPGPGASSSAAPATPSGSASRGRGQIAAIGLGFALAIGLILILTLPYWGPAAGLQTAAEPDLTPMKTRLAETDAHLGQLEARIAGLEAALKDAAAKDAAAKEAAQKIEPDLAQLADRVGQVDGKLAALERGLADLAARPEPKPGIDPTALTALSDQIAALKAEIGKSSADNGALRDRLAALEDAGKKSAERDPRPAALVLAVGQLRAALATPAPYGAALGAVAALASDDPAAAAAISTLNARASIGIPTLGLLTTRFDEAADNAARAAIVAGEPGMISEAWARLRRLVVIRRVDGEAAGPGADSALARAGGRLAAGDLKGAVDALATLEGKEADAMRPWLTDARARLAAEAALDSLSARAALRLGQGKP